MERNSLDIIKRETRQVRNDRTKAWHRDDPARSYCLAAKGRARRLGVAFDLTPEDIVFPDKCPVLGIPVFFTSEGKRNDNTPSLDRIIPELGYTKNNVEMISWRANRLKNDAKLHELERLVRYMRDRRMKAWIL